MHVNRPVSSETKFNETCNNNKNVAYSHTSASLLHPICHHVALPQPNTIVPLPATLQHHVLPDSAANGIFICDDANAQHLVTNITPSQPRDRVQLTLPDGSCISSSATGLLRNPPGIPPLEAHLFPGLHSDALLGLRPLCDHGLTVTFTYDTVTVADPAGFIVWTGPRDLTTGMWQLPLGSTPSLTSPINSTAPAFFSYAVC